MITIKSEQIICVDIDDTLVIHAKPKPEDSTVQFIDPYDGSSRTLVKHSPHIKILKDRKVRGATIIVWSQSGYKWAETIIHALGLENDVDFVMSKPIAYIDDKPVEQWMAERIYLLPNSNYGKF